MRIGLYPPGKYSRLNIFLNKYSTVSIIIVISNKNSSITRRFNLFIVLPFFQFCRSLASARNAIDSKPGYLTGYYHIAAGSPAYHQNSPSSGNNPNREAKPSPSA